MARCFLSILVWGGPWLISHLDGNEPSPADRGRQALLERPFTPAAWNLSAYDNLWKVWGPSFKEAPPDHDRLVRERYGLHDTPYPNGRLPMGLREGKNFLGKGLTSDCLLCHGSSIAGTSYVGLGNASLDIQALFEDLGKASGSSGKLPFTFSRVRGTSEAGAMAVFLLSYREPDLTVRLSPLNLGLRDDLVEDVPAWWHLKKKRTMYYTGTSHARSVRSIMQFMLSPLNPAEKFRQEEPTFADIQAYILSLEPPRYPFPIDHARAERGRTIFNKTCASCHGSYGKDWTYPNKIVPIDVIGTDRNRFEGFTKESGEHYNRSWFAQEKGEGYSVTPAVGYQAPPLDGIWATAPYFHNGSVPTVAGVLDTKTRPRIFTRSYQTGIADYDSVQLGWKIQVLDRGPDPGQPALERRKVYDTTQPGRGNQGHTFGDRLNEEERAAVIEYLKTL